MYGLLWTILAAFLTRKEYYGNEGFEQIKNSFWRNSMTYGTPCHTIGHFAFWYHHVTYRMPCHASGHLVVYREWYGFERASSDTFILSYTLIFNLKQFYTTSNALIWSKAKSFFNLHLKIYQLFLNYHKNMRSISVHSNHNKKKNLRFFFII